MFVMTDPEHWSQKPISHRPPNLSGIIHHCVLTAEVIEIL